MNSDELKWARRFLELAQHISTWSKDSTKVGSVITNPATKQIIGIGYNGFPRGVKDNLERYQDRDTKLKMVVHAEVNAILNANQSVRGMDIYVYPTMMCPASCPDCCKFIVQSGIKRLFYWDNNETTERWQTLAYFSKVILDEGGVTYQAISFE